MKKLLVLVAVAAALTACSKKEEAPVAAPAPAAAPAAPTPAPAAAPAAAPTTSAADLPQECNDYLAKVQTCVSAQSGAAADAMKSSMDQTKAAWASMGTDKAALGQACKAASDAFAAQASAMKC
ncbi:hypothetical protein ACSFBX_30250 [Variovorax sp. RB2P76]|jgi:hypothetical protein|uniref:hypothetical protein n=1 Tax=unclassified Variovorax TaxID=663243 RepID=UPI003F4785D6